MAPHDFRARGAATPTRSIPPMREAGRVLELTSAIFDDGAFLGGVEKMVTFRPKLKKTDGDAYIKELVHQINASKETLKMMLTKKDHLVDACHHVEEQLIGEMEGAVMQAENAAFSAANASASLAASAQAQSAANSQVATAEEMRALNDEKERLCRQNEQIQENLRKIEEA